MPRWPAGYQTAGAAGEGFMKVIKAWAVLAGTLVDGFKIYGPFDSLEAAQDYESKYLRHYLSEVVPIRDPKSILMKTPRGSESRDDR